MTVGVDGHSRELAGLSQRWSGHRVVTVESWPQLPEHCAVPAARCARLLEEQRGNRAFTVEWERTLAERARAVVDQALSSPQQHGIDHLVAQRFWEDAAERELLVVSVITRASMFWPLSLLIYGRPQAEDLKRAAGTWVWENVERVSVLRGGEPEEFRGTTETDIDRRVATWLKERVLSVDTSGARALTETTPMVTATYPTAGRGPARFAAIIPPALAGVDELSLVVRLRRQDGPETLDNVVSAGMLDQEAADFVRRCVLSRLNIFVGGDTGTGKSTLQALLCREIPESEWLWTVEDSAELELRSRILRDGRPAHAWTTETTVVSAGSAEQRAPADAESLIRQGLRHRPDRIFVGEARGGELMQVLEAITAGHPGGITTLHAQSLEEVPQRMMVMLLQAQSRPGEELAGRLIDMALQVCVFLQNRGGRHLVEKIAVYSASGAATLVYERDPGDVLRRSVTHLDALPERIRQRLRPFGSEVAGR